MYKVKLLAVVILFQIITLPAFAEKLKVATSDWPPYSGRDLPGQGVAVDIVRTALKRAGYEPEITIESWPRTLEGVNVGVYDVIAAAWYTEQRAKAFTFSQPYLYNAITFIKRKDSSFDYNSLADLNGRVVGVVKGYAYGDEFYQARGFVKVAANHVIQNLLRLAQGQIDVTLGDKRALLYEINTYMKNNRDQFVILPRPLSVKGLRIAVSKQNPKHEKIASDFDKAIKEMNADETLVKIIERFKKESPVINP